MFATDTEAGLRSSTTKQHDVVIWWFGLLTWVQNGWRSETETANDHKKSLARLSLEAKHLENVQGCFLWFVVVSSFLLKAIAGNTLGNSVSWK